MLIMSIALLCIIILAYYVFEKLKTSSIDYFNSNGYIISSINERQVFTEISGKINGNVRIIENITDVSKGDNNSISGVGISIVEIDPSTRSKVLTYVVNQISGILRVNKISAYILSYPIKKVEPIDGKLIDTNDVKTTVNIKNFDQNGTSIILQNQIASVRIKIYGKNGEIDDGTHIYSEDYTKYADKYKIGKHIYKIGNLSIFMYVIITYTIGTDIFKTAMISENLKLISQSGATVDPHLIVEGKFKGYTLAKEAMYEMSGCDLTFDFNDIIKDTFNSVSYFNNTNNYSDKILDKNIDEKITNLLQCQISNPQNYNYLNIKVPASYSFDTIIIYILADSSSGTQLKTDSELFNYGTKLVNNVPDSGVSKNITCIFKFIRSKNRQDRHIKTLNDITKNMYSYDCLIVENNVKFSLWKVLNDMRVIDNDFMKIINYTGTIFPIVWNNQLYDDGYIKKISSVSSINSYIINYKLAVKLLDNLTSDIEDTVNKLIKNNFNCYGYNYENIDKFSKLKY